MLKRTTDFFVSVAERWMPDPLVIAIFLTGVALVAALMFTDFTAGQAVEAWGNSYWALLRFTAQMILILALGHVLASTHAVRRLLIAVASLVRSAQMAYVGLTIFASLAALVSWGLGLIVPAVLSRIIADNCRERGIKVHFPLLVACAYSGAVVAMQGLSASIPLVLNTPDHFLESEIGLIGLDQTIFSWWSMSIVVAIMIILPQVMCRLAPHDEHVVELRPSAGVEPIQKTGTARSSLVTPSQHMENARWITLLLAFLGGIYVVRYFLAGGQLQLDSLNTALHRATGECSQGGGAVSDPVPPIFRIDGPDCRFRTGRIDCRWIRCSGKCRHAVNLDLLQCRLPQHFHTIRGRAVGCPGPHRHGGGDAAWRGYPQGRHGRNGWRGLDQYHTAAVRGTRAGDRRAAHSRHHGLQRHRIADAPAYLSHRACLFLNRGVRVEETLTLNGSSKEYFAHHHSCVNHGDLFQSSLARITDDVPTERIG
jgi:hypothetical protein